LSELSSRERQSLADRVIISVFAGDGEPNSRLVEIDDGGAGIAAVDFPRTILSLGESNKIRKRYVVGAYGQGGSSTFACSRLTLISSRRSNGSNVAFTVVHYHEPPPDDEAKVGNYVYLTSDGVVLTAEVESPISGTHIKHFGYDLTRYNASLGPTSVYGLLNAVLFDPVIPIWLNDGVHKYRRVIKGSRSALNGAVDEGDETKKGPVISHSVPIYYVGLGDFGSIGIEYWVLEATEKNKQPIRAFLDPARPIVLTLHGQSHAEMPQTLVRKDAELPYLRQRLICHIDCNRLTPGAKRAMFVSNREEARKGHVYGLIEQELIRALRSDDELARLNAEAREEGLKEQDTEAQKQMQAEVARLLRMQGISVELAGGAAADAVGTSKPVMPRAPRGKPIPIELREPPTYIRIVWPEDSAVTFYPQQGRYVRIETNAPSHYHNAVDSLKSRFNFIIDGLGIELSGTTPLKDGRMRAVVRAKSNAAIGDSGGFRVELARPGMATIADSRNWTIVQPPLPTPPKRAVSVPRIDPRPIDPTHPQWAILDWPPDDSTFAASESEMEEGTLVVWYSTIFPSYASELAALEQRDVALAKSFTTRYSIWLAVHSLLFQEEGLEAIDSSLDEGAATNIERKERRRLARLAAMMAMREIRELKSNMVETASA
jgi:hypothetical protein